MSLLYVHIYIFGEVIFYEFLFIYLFIFAHGPNKYESFLYRSIWS